MSSDLTITVKTLSLASHSVTVPRTMTLSAFKAHLTATLCAPASEATPEDALAFDTSVADEVIGVVYNGSVLTDANATLESIGITSGDHVVITTAVNIAPTPPATATASASAANDPVKRVLFAGDAAPAPAATASSPSSSSSSSQPSRTWTCDVCTYVNLISAEQCEMCDSSVPVDAPALSAPGAAATASAIAAATADTLAELQADDDATACASGSAASAALIDVRALLELAKDDADVRIALVTALGLGGDGVDGSDVTHGALTAAVVDAATQALQAARATPDSELDDAAATAGADLTTLKGKIAFLTSATAAEVAGIAVKDAAVKVQLARALGIAPAAADAETVAKLLEQEAAAE